MKAILRRYGLPALIIAALYAGNRLLFIPHTAGMLHRLLAWHFADFLAGGLMLCVLDCALELSGRQPVRRAASALGFPLYLARSTGDWRDVAAVCLGGLTMHGILKRTK